MATAEQIEVAAKALCTHWGENWECCCTSEKGLNCDCGDAIPEFSKYRDNQMGRNDYRDAAKVALETTT